MHESRGYNNTSHADAPDQEAPDEQPGEHRTINPREPNELVIALQPTVNVDGAGPVRRRRPGTARE
jgi:hypothetical protein